MAQPYLHIIVLILEVVFVAACASTPAPTSPPAAVLPTSYRNSCRAYESTANRRAADGNIP